jgi:hypothetical protein
MQKFQTVLISSCYIANAFANVLQVKYLLLFRIIEHRDFAEPYVSNCLQQELKKC